MMKNTLISLRAFSLPGQCKWLDEVNLCVTDDSVIGTFTTTDPDTTSPNNEIAYYYITGNLFGKKIILSPIIVFIKDN